MRGATWMLLGLGGVVTPAAGQNFSFVTVLEGETPINTAGQPLANVGQVVLQDDNAVAAIVGVGPIGSPVHVVTFNATPGNSFAAIIASEGQSHSTFNTSGAGSFGEFNNLAASNGVVTFVGTQSTGNTGRGVFRYDVNTSQPSTIHFDDDDVNAWNGVLNTGVGLPAYGVNTAGGVVFSAATGALPPPGDQFVARFSVGSGSTRIHDDSSGVTNYNYPDSGYPTRKVLTEAGHAVFIGDDNQGVSRIYNVTPGPSPVRSERPFSGGVTYEADRLLAASGDDVNGVTLFRAFKNRPNPNDEGWSIGALLVQSTHGLTEVGAFDLNDGALPEVTAVMSDNGRIAAFIPDATGGHVAYYDAAAGGLVQTLGANANVGDGFKIQGVSIGGGSVPMVNENGMIVFDAIIVNDDDDARQALIAWSPDSNEGPSIVIKTGDTVSIDGSDVTIAQLISNSPYPIGDLAYDADVLKDGLNENDYLAFGVRYVGGENGQGSAILLTHVPEPAGLAIFSLAGVFLMRRGRKQRAEKNSGQGEGIPDRCRRGE